MAKIGPTCPFGKPGGMMFKAPSTRPLRGICGPSCWLSAPRKTSRTCGPSTSETEILSPKLAEIEDAVPRFQAIKAGKEAPRRCEHCAYCRATRKLTQIADAEELGASYVDAED